jgi:multiple sugar transport system permease protein
MSSTAAPAPPAAVAARSTKRPRKLRLNAAYVFLLPYVVLLILFGIIPGVYALVISFAKFVGGRPQFFQAGLANYVTAYSDIRFVPALTNVFRYLLLSIPIGIIGVLFLSLWLHARPGRLSTTFRTIFFVPGAFAGPALVLLSFFMLSPDTSPFGFLLRGMGFETSTEVTLIDHYPVLFTIIGFFAGAGGWVAIFYGALNSISKEVLEAATMDGCNPWQAAYYIKMPLILPYIAYMIILVFAGNVQVFAEPQLFGAKYWSPNQLGYAYAFEIGNFGASAAISLLMVVIGLIGASLIIRFSGFYQTDATAT